MTRKEFEKFRMSIEDQDFSGNYSDPIEYGIQRAAFEQKKFQKLIAAARKVNMRTAAYMLAISRVATVHRLRGIYA